MVLSAPRWPTRATQAQSIPKGPSNVDSGSPGCKLRLPCTCWVPALQNLHLSSGNQWKSAPNRLLNSDVCGTTCVRSAMPTWATPSYL